MTVRVTLAVTVIVMIRVTLKVTARVTARVTAGVTVIAISIFRSTILFFHFIITVDTLWGYLPRRCNLSKFAKNTLVTCDVQVTSFARRCTFHVDEKEPVTLGPLFNICCFSLSLPEARLYAHGFGVCFSVEQSRPFRKDLFLRLRAKEEE